MNLLNVDPDTYVPIEQFYAGKSVLITGGTGFLGKVLIEKLIYSCSDLHNLYVLVRDKKKVSGHERLEKILENEVFTRIRNEKPEYLKKIVPVIGDITLQELGINEVDKRTIFEKVSVVFHLAATIKFNEPLKEAMRINVEGTRTMLHFAHKIKNLQAFVYMSTAFCNTDKIIVEEIVYPPPMEIDQVYEFLKIHGDDDEKVQEILKGRPNTYTFTKALIEPMVADICSDIPTAIVRPSVVVAAMHEPLRGWIDTWLGPTPALDMIARGWLKCLYGHDYYAFDIIPVDYVVNATIVAAAKCRRFKKISVYNCCTSTINTLSLRQMYIHYTKQSAKAGYRDSPLNIMVFTKSFFILNIITFIFQIVPAYVLDFFLILRRKPTKYVKLTQRLISYLKMIKFFSSRNWFMMSTKLRETAEDLNKMDQQKFPCNPAKISWSEFIPLYFDGVLKFLVSKTVTS